MPRPPRAFELATALATLSLSTFLFFAPLPAASAAPVRLALDTQVDARLNTAEEVLRGEVAAVMEGRTDFVVASYRQPPQECAEHSCAVDAIRAGGAAGLLVISAAALDEQRALLVGKVLWVEGQRRPARTWHIAPRAPVELAAAIRDVTRAVLAMASGAPVKGLGRIALIPTQFDPSAAGAFPKVIDDALLTMVHDATLAWTIGSSDIDVLLGDNGRGPCPLGSGCPGVGDRLGVDELIVVKIARLGEKWMVAAKLIDIKQAQVAGKVGEIFGGEPLGVVKAMPGVFAKLFAQKKAQGK